MPVEIEHEIPRLDELAGYVSAARAAELLSVNDARVRQLVGQGILHAARWGGKALMIERDSIEDVIALQAAGYRKPGPARGSGGRPRKTRSE